MEGAHDLGGLGGFGAVRGPGADATHDEPWELRAQFLALMACRGARGWIERIDNPTYLTTGYYGRWLLAGEAGAVANGHITTDDLAAARLRIDEASMTLRAGSTGPAVAELVAAASPDTELVERVEQFMTVPSPMAPANDPRFAPGDLVRPKRMYDDRRHHRCPRYVRGVVGVVERICGDDRLAGYRGYDVIEPVYTVRFSSLDVFGERLDEPRYVIHVDLWQSYLDPVGTSMGDQR